MVGLLRYVENALDGGVLIFIVFVVLIFIVTGGYLVKEAVKDLLWRIRNSLKNIKSKKQP